MVLVRRAAGRLKSAADFPGSPAVLRSCLCDLFIDSDVHSNAAPPVPPVENWGNAVAAGAGYFFSCFSRGFNTRPQHRRGQPHNAA